MPSGAKKRKAAKKKKEQAANYPHGNDDPKSQDERDSDGGDAGSPASQDGHNHHHPFNQWEDDGKRAQSHVTEDKSLKDAKSIEKSGLDVVDIKIEKGSEAKMDLESTHVSIQHVEHDKISSSRSSSSSGDESQASEKKSNRQVVTSSDIPPAAETSNVAEKYHASASIGSQPLVAPSPQPLQRTSLLRCCGLFQVFTGSRR